VSRRTSLPGVDELFGKSGRPGDRERSSAQDPAFTPADRTDHPTTEARAVVRQMTADEGATIRGAREAAQDVEVPSPEVGALLRWAATACEARAVVEIGSAGGLSGLWLLQGMTRGGVLTSLEPDPETYRLATTAFKEVAAGSRVRSIHGDVSTLLERLADASYDLVLLQADKGSYPQHLVSARTLLRPGGMLVARGILPTGEHRPALTRFLHDLVEDPALSATVLPIDDGVAIANRLRSPAPSEE